MYDQRERELRDYEWTLASVREEAHRLGREQGRHMRRLAKSSYPELLGDSPMDDEASRGMSS
ncbi:MAG: hypothetical protein R3C99_09660 [Pirellulaceae bacterium]